MRLFKFALPILFLAGVALFASRAWTETEDAAKRQLAVEHSRAQFVQHAGVVRGASDARYPDEQRQLLRTWFAEQTELNNRFPAHRGEPAPFIPPAPKVKGGDMQEYFEFANSSVGGWRENKFDLFQSAEINGLRFDVLRVARVPGKSHLSVDLAVWGAPEEVETEEAREGQGRSMHASVPLSFKGLSIKFLDEKGKEMAGMPIDGEPSLRLDIPERLVADAPPGVVLVRYEPGLFPRDAAMVEWTLSAAVRTVTGENRPLQMVFKTKLDPAWAVDAGQAWGGKEVTASAR